MKSSLCHITLYGSGDSFQEVRVEYDLEWRIISDGFFGFAREYFLTRVKVLDPVLIEPTDLICDITEQIAFQECLLMWRVRMECKPEVLITAEETVKH
jgi:hypothetical protein